ncbi:hypothetical protein L1887_33995 [Cichorium endivia]|nr:hypothetical protein L1887_33995 [Cichorium endivia]
MALVGGLMICTFIPVYITRFLRCRIFLGYPFHPHIRFVAGLLTDDDDNISRVCSSTLGNFVVCTNFLQSSLSQCENVSFIDLNGDRIK